MSKFSKGDVVTVQATVRYNMDADDDQVGIEVEKHHPTVFVPVDKVTLVHRHFEVGERVWAEGDESYGIIRAIHDGLAWIELENVQECYRTIALKWLEKAPVLAAPLLEAAE